ncbi:retrovirus-related pol polyprotein from transposon TNT 1-94 [Tanacetum coccineum]
MESLTLLPPPEKSSGSFTKLRGTVTVSETEPTTPSVPTEVKNTEQELKINDLTKLVKVLIDEKDSLLHDMQKGGSAKGRIIGPQIIRLIYGSYDNFMSRHNRVIHIRGGVLSESSHSSESLIGVKCNTCGSTIHSTTDHNEFDHFKRGEKIQATKAGDPPKSGFTKESNPSLLIMQRHIREPSWYLDSRCSSSVTGVKSYLHKYLEQPGLKVVFGDNSSCITEGYGSINCGGIIFTKVTFVNGLKYNLISISQLCDAKYTVQFNDKQRTIFNANKEIVLIAPRRNDVYVIDMSSLTPNGAYFFAKALESINWLWHKRLSHLNFKNINKLAKQNKVLGLRSLVYSKDKPCSACEKGKHHRASFKTKQNFSIRKYLHLLHMDLFGPVSPMSINHEKYTLVIVDEYSRNHELESFCDEKGISQNFSSPYTPEQNGVAEKKNRTLIEAARTMLNGSVMSKHFWTEAVRKPDILLSQKLSESSTQEDNRYPPDEFLHKENLVPEVIGLNEPGIPLTEDNEGPLDLINTEGTLEQNVQNEQITTQPTEGPSGTNTEISVSINESSAPDVPRYHISNQASTSSHPAPQDRWSKDQHIKIVNIIGDPEPKKASEALKHPGWVDAMQEELNQFYRNKVWTLVPLPYGKTAIGSKWVFKNKKDEHVTGYSSVSKGIQPKFTPKLIQSSQNSISQADPKVQKDYKAEYKKMKAKLALLEANPSTSQTPKTFQPKNKGLVAETFDWDEEENHARNGEWIDITMRKVNILLSMDEDADSQNYPIKYKLDAVTFQIQIQNTELTKLNHALQEKLKVEKKINEKWLTSSKKVSQCISDQIPHQKKKVLGGKMLTESSLKINENENLFVPASMGYYHEMVPKPKIGLKDSTLTADFQTLILEEF